jgi:hypothetical protein
VTTDGNREFHQFSEDNIVVSHDCSEKTKQKLKEGRKYILGLSINATN